MNNDSFVVIDKNTTIFSPKTISTPLQHALDMIIRDHKKVFGMEPELKSSLNDEPNLVIRYAMPEDDCPDWPEAFCFRYSFHNLKWAMHIIGRDELGLIYGMLHYSQHYLGIDPFWFWADLPIKQKTNVAHGGNRYL